jgi:phosphomannomutase
MQDILKSIFKAYDVRGKVGSELTPEVVEKIGASLANWLPKDGAVAVGYDMRPDSQELAAAMIKGLTEQGRNVWDIGLVTSDMIYFATGHHELAGGAMITASHNPGEYNGIKFCREEAKPIGIESGLLQVRDGALKDWPHTSLGTVRSVDVTEDWITHVLNFIDPKKLRELKVAVDAGNGMAGKIVPELEPYVPFDVIEMYFELDGSFPNHIANPLEPKNLKDLQKTVRDKKCDVGIAFDGDGDRAVLVDEKGEPLSGSVMTALLSDYFLKLNPGATILYNAICGRIVPETIEAKGGTAIRTRVGHSYIKSDMFTHGAVFAGEHSGHYYFLDNYRADSGLIAAVIALYIISVSKKPLSKIVAPYRKAYQQIPETNFEVADKKKVIGRLTKELNQGNQDLLDGLTVTFTKEQLAQLGKKTGKKPVKAKTLGAYGAGTWGESGTDVDQGEVYAWVNVRPSNTEPVLRMNAEAKTKPALKKLVTIATDIITQ